MGDVIINTGDDDEPETPAEVVEPVAEAAVTIAAIEADRDVTLAQIDADRSVAVAEIHADADAERVQGSDELWQNINRLSAEVSGMSLQLATITGMLEAISSPPQSLSSQEIPPELVEEVTLESLPETIETAPEAPSIPTSTSPGTASTPTAPIVESALAEVGALVPPVVEIRGGPIVRLV